MSQAHTFFLPFFCQLHAILYKSALKLFTDYPCVAIIRILKFLVLKIENFLQSPLAWRMWLAQRRGGLYREQPFVLGIDARRLKSDFPETETVLIQGIIDVFFEEEDGIVLLDYKTDAISSMKELWNRYETQLDYYQEAVRKLSGKPVKERILYSFHLETY